MLAEDLADLGLEPGHEPGEVAFGLHHDLDLPVRHPAYAPWIARPKGNDECLARDPHAVGHGEDGLDLADRHFLKHGPDEGVPGMPGSDAPGSFRNCPADVKACALLTPHSENADVPGCPGRGHDQRCTRRYNLGIPWRGPWRGSRVEAEWVPRDPAGLRGRR